MFILFDISELDSLVAQGFGVMFLSVLVLWKRSTCVETTKPLRFKDIKNV